MATGLSKADISAARANGYRILKAPKGASGAAPGLVRLAPPRGMSPTTARERLRRAAGKSTVDVNHLYYLQGTTCEGRTCAWQLTMTGWSEPATSSCTAAVPVGMLDTGIDVSAVDITGARIVERRLAQTAGRRAPTRHGTAIASILLGARTRSSPRLLKGATVFAADVFFLDDRGQAATDVPSLVAGLEWLHRKGVRIVNLSLAGPPNAVLEHAVHDLTGKGMIFVAAAGNSGPGAAPSYPAAYPGVIAVTAVDRWEKVYARANQGAHIAIAAPGVGLRIASSEGRTVVVSGTSYATPFVLAALAAWPATTETAAQPAATGPLAVLDRLAVKDLGMPGIDPVYGRGLLRAPASCGRPAIETKAPGSRAQ